MNMGSTVDSQYLRSAGRSMMVPFRLKLECNGQPSELVCTRVLRVLPGKRLVCFGEWNGKQVVVKFFLDRRSAKHHCIREERGLSAFRVAGIKTPALMFRGVLPPDSTPVLGFQRIIPVQNVTAVWEQAKTTDQPGELLSRAVAAIADQHEAGLKQDDLHLGNFLISGDDIYTIDGDAVDTRQMGKPLPEAKSLRNMGLFFAQLYPRFDWLIPKVFQVYAERRAWPVGHGLVASLMKEVHSQRNCRKKDYLKKIYRECSAFACRKAWECFMVCDRDFYKEKMACFLDDPDPVIDASRLLKDGNTSTVALVEVGGQRLVVKRYNIKNAWHAIKRCFRPSRAWVSWRNAHRLGLLGIPTPKPIAFLEKRWGPFRSKAYFIMEYVDGIDAYHLLHSDRAREINREGLVKRFGKLLQLFADASISHGDFKATNFIVANEGLSIIDVDGMCEHRLRWRFRRAFRRDCKRLMKNWTDLPEVARMFRDQLTNIQL